MRLLFETYARVEDVNQKKKVLGVFKDSFETHIRYYKIDKK